MPKSKSGARQGPIGRLLDRLAFVIFGQRAPDSKPVTWIPGSGGHGGEGGQTPPYVPYNPDWDPANRPNPRRRRTRKG
jgi:hypothetical protein